MRHQKIINIIESDDFSELVGNRDQLAMEELADFRCWLRSDGSQSCRKNWSVRGWIAYLQRLLD